MHVMENGELSEAECSTIGSQIVSIMRYLHKKNIVLRNMSMNTFAFGEPGHITDVKLIDMLTATRIDKLHKEAHDRLDQ